LQGSGSFFLDDEEVKVEQGDMLSIESRLEFITKGNDLMLLYSPWEAIMK